MRLNIGKLFQKYIYPHLFHFTHSIRKPIKEGSGGENSCMCLMGVHICWCGAQRIQVAGGRYTHWGVRVRWGRRYAATASMPRPV
jgi:hypothetical protein